MNDNAAPADLDAGAFGSGILFLALLPIAFLVTLGLQVVLARLVPPADGGCAGGSGLGGRGLSAGLLAVVLAAVAGPLVVWLDNPGAILAFAVSAVWLPWVVAAVAGRWPERAAPAASALFAAALGVSHAVRNGAFPHPAPLAAIVGALVGTTVLAAMTLKMAWLARNPGVGVVAKVRGRGRAGDGSKEGG